MTEERKPGEPPTFEKALQQLEEVVRTLETGQVGLEEALAQYETGIGLLKSCHARLAAAEKRILQLVGTNEEGEAELEPFGHQASHAAPAPRRELWDEEG